MGIKSYKPYTPSRRTATGSTFSEITKKKPEKSLTKPRKEKAGRDAWGHISIRQRGGGVKRRYRIVDWRRDKETGRFSKVDPVDPAWCAQVEIRHSMPEVVRKPIAEPVAWAVAYRIPLSLFTAYRGVGGVKPGDVWSCNMYKCGGSDHWACWSPIARELNFHQPKFFGQLVFA